MYNVDSDIKNMELSINTDLKSCVVGLCSDLIFLSSLFDLTITIFFVLIELNFEEKKTHTQSMLINEL